MTQHHMDAFLVVRKSILIVLIRCKTHNYEGITFALNFWSHLYWAGILKFQNDPNEIFPETFLEAVTMLIWTNFRPVFCKTG